LRVAPALQRGIAWDRAAVAPLLRFGGWMTVTNVVGPLMVTFDRFLIGALVSLSAVAYYAAPYEAVTKFLLISGAMMGVMFPAFSTSSIQDRGHMALLFDRSVKYLLLVPFPLLLLGVVLAHEGLSFWLGATFAQNSVHVLQWLAVGVFINSIAQVPFALVQGVGKPDLTGKLHLVELPVYLVMLWWLTKTHGIEGTAIAWTGRALVDAVVLFALAKQFLPARTSSSLPMILLAVLALVTLVLAALLNGLVLKCVFFLLTITSFSFFAWFMVLSPEERDLAQSYL